VRATEGKEPLEQVLRKRGSAEEFF